jgi:hypothetical protein
VYLNSFYFAIIFSQILFQILIYFANSIKMDYLQSAIQKLGGPELHMAHPIGENVHGGSFNNQKKYSYCGPGTKVDQRIAEGYVGVNRLDRACKYHDLYYSEIPSEFHNLSDIELAKLADEVAANPDDTGNPNEEVQAAKIVSKIMKGKSKLGLGINKKSVYSKMPTHLHSVYLTKKEYDKFLKTGNLVIEPHIEVEIPLDARQAKKLSTNSALGKKTSLKFEPKLVHNHNMYKNGGFIQYLLPALGPLLIEGVKKIGSYFFPGKPQQAQ